jgi:simple sugar transport system permease protein
VTTVVPPAGGGSPAEPSVDEVEPSGPGWWQRVRRLPVAVQYAGLSLAVVLVMSIVRELSGADALTGSSAFRSALQLSMPIALAGLGGLWAERAGVVNIGLEGMMILGTWFGAWGGIEFGPWQGVLLGILGGALGGLLHAVATVTFGVDHIVSGVAINLLGDGITRFLTNVAYEGSDKASPSLPHVVTSFDVPGVSQLAEQIGDRNAFFWSDLARIVEGLTTDVSLLVVLGILLFPLTFYVLWRTPFGLRLRSVGEDPEAAESLGVKVYSMKYAAVVMSGALAGLGGVVLVYLFGKQFQVNQTNGRGFIGLAAMIFGNWRPGGLAAGAGLFGFMDSLQSQSDDTSHALLLVVAILFAVLAIRSLVLRRTRSAIVLGASAVAFGLWYQLTDEIPTEFIPFLPHITTLLVLVFATQRLRPPAADGKVFRRGGGG